MPPTLRAFESTPNPNALKCVIEPAPRGERRSYASRDEAEAAEDTLAQALFGVEGVERVMVLGGFVTVNKSSEAKWSKLRPALRRALERVG